VKLLVCELLFRKYTHCTALIWNKCCYNVVTLKHSGLRNGKGNLNFEIFCLNVDFASQARINIYTLILEKDFQISKWKKKVIII